MYVIHVQCIVGITTVGNNVSIQVNKVADLADGEV